MKALMIIFCLGLLSTTLVYAKEVAGYRFEDYPANIYQGKKAPLKLGKYKPLKTHLINTHKDGEIGFAGNYMVGMWSCGTGCVSGAMIDKRTGKIYDFPVSNIDYRCYSSEETPDDEDIFFYPNSRLLITTSCEQDEDTNGYAKQTFTYFISVWNEKSKTFKSIDKVKRTKTVKID